MTAVATETLIAIEGVGKTFPGQRALADVSFEIERGEIHALVGENGSGKSTLIKILAGFHEPDPGSRIAVAGEELKALAPADVRRLGLRFVHQDLGLVAELSAAENVGLASGFAKRGPKVDWAGQCRRADALLARIGVEVDVELPVAELRAVERSAIAIARALDELHGEIRLLVLDEPTAALPPAEVDALFRVLREVLEQGVSILYVSHRLEEILGLADRVTVLRDGRCKGTFPIAGMDRARLAELIVGEEVEADAAQRPPSCATEERALTVRGMRGAVLDGVGFELRRGEVLGIAGLSGSGREELAAVLTGAAPGQIELVDGDGRTWSGMTPKRAKQLGLALVLANRHPDAAIGQFSIRENVSLAQLPSYVRGGRVRGAQERGAVERWIADLDIRPDDPDRLYSYLSGGNKQKVILAKWLNTSPRVFVMDDPTSGVDIGARHGIYGLVREQAATGAGFVVCSSDLEDFVGVCDRVLALVGGRVAAELSGAEITENRLLQAIVTQTGKNA
ncbi:sugar ABC transporter ATP-binding protein [Conexibacter stalactiti]|uniref:Sugar ABC transporter ATP-binding protein n=1 Tax=Conexibacter stalactiti TaxID=1940611 RepID=A0ABU4HLC4_9ACTN|nr:sugar ABC transporter ATP-binding protein [Conexibacter stalactiti]MDW5592804.1 sugar ABC transporter ATP-binding protein [Conexibacter stalactiti]MEC5033445.1 sugar ABC transporter ATP-binding protein [Conexibacter stalactiti]